MAERKFSAGKISFVYIGMVVGAGFASGQEILQFFTVFGSKGLLGIVLATILFVLFGLVIMGTGRRFNAHSHVEILKPVLGQYFGRLGDFVITFSLFGGMVAMLAGSGAVLNQQFGIPSFLGSILMAGITVITVLKGIEGVINSISMIVPLLIAWTIGISIFSAYNPGGGAGMAIPFFPSPLIGGWWSAAILYVSYNIVLCISVLGPLGKMAKNKRAITFGALYGGIGLGICAALLHFAMLNNCIYLNAEIPIMSMIGHSPWNMGAIYSGVLLAEIYTSAVGSLYGLYSRARESKYRIVFITAGALLLSEMGFSNVIKGVYPTIGYAGIILLAGLVGYICRRKC